MSQSILAPSVTGQDTEAVVSPAARATSHSGAARRSVASSYQRPVTPVGDQMRLKAMPWRAGRTPVTIVAWPGYVTLGNTGVTARAWLPAVTSARRAGAAYASSR